jgi:hypothetical protein
MRASTAAEHHSQRRRGPRAFETVRVKVKPDKFDAVVMVMPFQNEVIKSRGGERPVEQQMMRFSEEFRHMMQ